MLGTALATGSAASCGSATVTVPTVLVCFCRGSFLTAAWVDIMAMSDMMLARTQAEPGNKNAASQDEWSVDSNKSTRRTCTPCFTNRSAPRHCHQRGVKMKQVEPTLRFEIQAQNRRVCNMLAWRLRRQDKEQDLSRPSLSTTHSNNTTYGRLGFVCKKNLCLKLIPASLILYFYFLFNHEGSDCVQSVNQHPDFDLS